ncbi:MAG TPA: TIM-barrel domain-containing protein [Gemmatimonadales bacterium]|nr:TIM-barrel domain-containing protein [Gemmatimonadales bacterium]
MTCSRMAVPSALLALWSAPLAAQQGAWSVRLAFTNTVQQTDQLELSHFLRDDRPLGPSDIRVTHLKDGVTEIASAAPGPATWEFRIRESAPVYGFGERFDALDQARRILVNASADIPGPKGSGTYAPIPFFMDLRGYGLWVDTYSEAVFDLGVSDHDAFVVRLRDTRLRILFIEGPQFPRILERFTGMVGRAKLPPYWAFAPWKSRNWHPDMAAVYEDVERYRQLGLPASVLVLDSPWATNYNTFEMNRLQFRDPEAMVRHVHDLGFKLCLWLTAFINEETFTPPEPELVGKIPLTAASNFEEARQAGYFLKTDSGDVHLSTWWKGRGGLIDFTNPAAVAWWQGQVRKAIRLGADAFKADGGEGSFVGDARFADGEAPAVMRTRYSVLYNQALQQLIDGDLHGDGVLFMRSGSVGNHNLPFLWAGDNESNFSAENGLPGVVLAGLNAGLSGIPLWTSDLGGYEKGSRTPGDSVLFARWTEFSAFSPIMELHSDINLGPWDYGPQALDIFRTYSRLHMSLFPYRYAAAQEASRTGMPLIRALVLFHPLDPDARRATDEYYFGPDLLVAPVLTALTQRTVHLPGGEWLDYWSGARYTGPTDLVVDAPLGRIPLFVKAGTILPRIPEDVMTLVPWRGAGEPPVPTLDDRRVYEIYPGPARNLVDFEGRRLDVAAGEGRTSLSLSGAPARVTIVWRFQHPRHVTLDGRPVALQADGASVSVTFAHTAESRLVWW